MLTTDTILGITKNSTDCLNIARADKAILTLQAQGRDNDIDRILDFFMGYARGYEEAMNEMKKVKA